MGLWSKAEYVERLRARRRALNGECPGARRALGMAIGYLEAAEVARARWMLRSMLEGEAGRRGEFWAASSRTLLRVVRELGAVGD